MNMMIKLLVIMVVCVQASQRAYKGELDSVVNWEDWAEPFVAKWIRPHTSKGVFLEEEIYMDSFFRCTNFEDCSFNGRCAPSGEFCVCNDDFATFEPDDGPHCNYRRKKGLTALLLHIFLGNGVEHFYVQRLGTGFALFFTVGYGLIVLACCIMCFVMYVFYANEDIRAVVGIGGIFLLVIFCLAIIGVWIWLIVLIVQNDLTDVNGVALKPV